MSILGNTTAGISKDTITGAASTIVEDNLTAGKVLVSDASGKVSAASVGIDDINPDGKYLKLSGGTLTGPLAVKNGSVTLNEGYSIGYGDGNYNFNQINGQFQLIKNKSSTEGVFIGTQANKADDYVALQTVVNSATQPMSTHINVRSNGVIDLSHEDSSSGSYFVNNVRIQGVANGTANDEAVNLRQLNNKIQYSTTDLTAGSSSLATGSLYVVYE